ncbi:phosphatase PAP2 family protein [Candidatus Uhrbacteria bacterium]|nr:phosphatase PAP2 family protein [Candidatus Uhrbacteria bacterium]
MDVDIFFFLNQFAGLDSRVDQVIYFLAVYAIFIFPLFLIGLRAWRATLFKGIYALCIAYLANALIALAWYRERPFRDLDAHVGVDTSTLFDSFPSDHAALAASAAVIILFASRRRGIAAAALAVCIAVSRIVVGVHYPSDVMAGIGIGILSAVLVEHYISKKNHNV